jgi:hypothetical protein
MVDSCEHGNELSGSIENNQSLVCKYLQIHYSGHKNFSQHHGI